MFPRTNPAMILQRINRECAPYEIRSGSRGYAVFLDNKQQTVWMQRAEAIARALAFKNRVEEGPT